MKRIRWGILSTGKIASSFTEDIKHVPDAEVVAVGSRIRPQQMRLGINIISPIAIPRIRNWPTTRMLM